MSSAQSFVYKIKAEYEGGDFKKLREELKTLSTIKSFASLTADIEKTEQALVKAEAEAVAVAKAMENSSDPKLTTQYNKLNGQIEKLTGKYQKQNSQLEKHAGILKESGIQATNLASAENKLTKSTTSQARAITAADKLGLRTKSQITAEVNDLQRAYKELKSSGLASTNDLIRAEKKLENQTESLNRELNDGVDGLSTKLGKVKAGWVALLGSLAGGVALGAGLTSAAAESAQHAKDLSNYANVANTSVEKFQGLAYAVKSVGIEADKFSDQTKDVREKLGDFLRGESGEFQDFFEIIAPQIDITAESLKGLSGPDVLQAVKNAMDELNISSEEQVAYLEDLASDASLLAPLLANNGEKMKALAAEAESFSYILSDADSKKVLEVSKSIEGMQASYTNMRDEMTAEFAPELITIMDNLAELMQDDTFRAALSDLISSAVWLAEKMYQAVMGIKGLWNTTFTIFKSVYLGITQVHKAITYFTDAVGLTEGAFEKVSTFSDELFQSVKDSAKAAGDSFGLMWDGFGDGEGEAKKTADEVGKSLGDIADKAKESGEKQKQISSETLTAMKKQYQEYANEIKKLQDDIAGREQSLAEELRAMSRTGMSDLGAWTDRKKEAQEYEVAARKAVEAGDWSTAVAMADKAKSAYKDLNKEVKAGDNVVVSAQQGLDAAMSGVERSGKLAIEALKEQQDAAHDAMETLTEKSGFKELGEGMDDAEKKWLDNWTTMRKAAIADIEEVEDRLYAIKDKEITVWVNQKEKHSEGGLAGASKLHFSKGGYLPGFGGGDQIDASLEAGEYVNDKFTVRHFSPDFFRNLKTMAQKNISFPSLPAVSAASLSSASSTPAMNFTFSSPMTAFDRQTAKTNARMVMNEFEKMYRGRS